MEYTKVEVAVLEKAVNDAAAETQARELIDLQLALIGGGIGDIVWG